MVEGACALKGGTKKDGKLRKGLKHELKNWLASRDAPTKGKKDELIVRYDILTRI